MPNFKFDFSRYIPGADQNLVNAPPLGGVLSPSGLAYLSKPARRDIGARPPLQLLPLEHLVSRWSSATIEVY